MSKYSKLLTNFTNGASRSMLYSLGMTHKDFNKYFVGIGSMYFDINPCNKHLERLQRKVEESLKNHRSIYPFKYNTIGV